MTSFPRKRESRTIRRRNYAYASTYVCGDWEAKGDDERLLARRSWHTFDPCPAPAWNDQSHQCSTALVGRRVDPHGCPHLGGAGTLRPLAGWAACAVRPGSDFPSYYAHCA